MNESKTIGTQQDKTPTKQLDSKKLIDDDLRVEEFQKRFRLVGEELLTGLFLFLKK